MPIHISLWFIAFLPILALLILMVGKQIPAYKAAFVGFIIASVCAILFYKAPFELLLNECLKGMWSALSIILVIIFAILIYEITNEVNAMAVFQEKMSKWCQNELMQILIIGLGFVSFMQGITGFGVPIAVGAPLLIGIGVKPLYAVLIPMIGHAWGATFGTLAAAWDALVETTGIVLYSEQYFSTALWIACFLAIINFLNGLIVCWIYGKKEGLKKGFFAILVISLIQGGGEILLSQVNPTVACFIPTVIGIVAVFLLNKLPMYNKPWRIENSEIMNREVVLKTQHKSSMTLIEAFLPYIILTILAITCLMIKPIHHFLSSWEIGFAFKETVTGYGIINGAVDKYLPIKLLVHAGTFLMGASVMSACYYIHKKYLPIRSTKNVLQRTLKKVIPSSLSIMILLMMSKVMSGSGQTEQLAMGVSKVFQGFYPLIAPYIGLLGTFMTSSTMASCILFGKFQETTAVLLDYKVVAILAAQAAGASIGNSISTSNLILGATTASIIGQEGKILRKSFPIALILCGLIGILLFLLLC